MVRALMIYIATAIWRREAAMMRMIGSLVSSLTGVVQRYNSHVETEEKNCLLMESIAHLHEKHVHIDLQMFPNVNLKRFFGTGEDVGRRKKAS
nr:hypothetical protein Iba_chr11aCG19650 [Ipomoea batatas]GMD53120.1 hypothetical protein Iba_chr11bCG18110 [Ipomoea batatas]